MIDPRLTLPDYKPLPDVPPALLNARQRWVDAAIRDHTLTETDDFVRQFSAFLCDRDTWWALNRDVIEASYMVPSSFRSPRRKQPLA